MSAALEITDLNHSYDEVEILNDIGLSIKKKEIFGLVGLNGVGKTTIIKSILGLMEPNFGEINILGHHNKSQNSRQDIAYLPEKFAPPIYLTGHEFLEFSMAFYGVAYNKKRAIELAEELDLKVDALNYTIKRYSKGMGQKLGLISVFLSGAKILILDEPMSGLDPKARIKLKRELKNYHKTNDATIFFSSHIMADIEELCDRIALIDKGIVSYIGNISNFMKKYQAANLEKALLNAIEIENVTSISNTDT